MVCPNCGGKTIVAYTIANDTSVVRKRKCVKCNHLFYTTEQQQDTAKYAFAELMRLKSQRAYSEKRVGVKSCETCEFYNGDDWRDGSPNCSYRGGYINCPHNKIYRQNKESEKAK